MARVTRGQTPRAELAIKAYRQLYGDRGHARGSALVRRTFQLRAKLHALLEILDPAETRVYYDATGTTSADAATSAWMSTRSGT